MEIDLFGYCKDRLVVYCGIVVFIFWILDVVMFFLDFGFC